MSGKSYTRDMTATNVTRLRSTDTDPRALRARFVHQLLKNERWSVRNASQTIGMTNSVLATRLNGTTPFLADELEAIAVLLKRDPVTFYADYLRAGSSGPETKMALTANGEGLKLPGLDSNQEPIGFMPAGALLPFRGRATGRREPAPAVPRTPAPIARLSAARGGRVAHSVC